MNLYIEEHCYAYELENVLRAFVPDVTVIESAPQTPHPSLDFAYLRAAKIKQQYRLVCMVRSRASIFVKRCFVDGGSARAVVEHALAGLLYDVMTSVTNIWPPWGIVTGVRPAKLAAGLLEQGMPDDAAAFELCMRHRVDVKKAHLAIQTARNGMRLAQENTRRAYSLYVSIPFCPSRCSYCSFISKTVERDRKLTDRYVAALCAELERTASIASGLHIRLETVYIGGGTPTVLTEAQLQMLTDCIARAFPVQSLREYTVEAGRPDTITQQKLAILKNAGVTRISINPQTANDAVRKAVGRNHTAKDVERAFAQARQAGFDNINMDVIAGLPHDDIESFKDTMNWLFALAPENITVHALTKKRASTLRELGGNPSRDAVAMVDYATKVLSERGYIPYYMYKQKGTVDILENTGYAKPGTACYYNIFMMEELHTVLACGAGAVTKLVNQRTGSIERIFNYKYPLEYIEGFDTLIERKSRVKTFYESIV